MVGPVTVPVVAPAEELPGWVTRVRASNPGPMTLDGTNSWVLTTPDGHAIVVDPGPADEEHLALLATPGHTDDSVCFRVEVGGERAVLTGDTILGRGTTVLDGDLGDYLRSLQRLAGLGPVPVLPGHGPALADCAAAARAYLEHREARLAQVREARAAGARTAREVVEIVYADVDPALWPAAEASVRAQLVYLESSARGV